MRTRKNPIAVLVVILALMMIYPATVATAHTSSSKCETIIISNTPKNEPAFVHRSNQTVAGPLQNGSYTFKPGNYTVVWPDWDENGQAPGHGKNYNMVEVEACPTPTPEPTPTPTPEPTPNPTPEPTPTPTPEPTETPSPTPTPEPTPESTPTPSPSDSPDKTPRPHEPRKTLPPDMPPTDAAPAEDNFSQFIVQVNTFVENLGENVQESGAAATQMIAWLAQNPPDVCYAPVWGDTWAIASLIDTFVQEDDKAIWEPALTSATTMMTRFGTHLRDALTACSAQPSDPAIT